jgi:RHS repeat-associated protein
MTYNSKNQLTNIYYDANGNQNGAYSPYTGNTYSVENRLTMEVLGSNPYPANIYAYDPWGKRVMSGYSPNYLNPQPIYNYTFYGITGQKLAMVTCNGSNYPAYPTCAIVGQNVYFGKKLITAGGVNVLTDRLGSVRANGQGESFAYYPYGEERTNRVDGREKFGTYFRDAVGQDYADQRYYGSGTGSFFTADTDSSSGNAGAPLGWNRYLYANGDPINHWDPRSRRRLWAIRVLDGRGLLWRQRRGSVKRSRLWLQRRLGHLRRRVHHGR